MTITLANKMMTLRNTVKSLLNKLSEIELDKDLSNQEKIFQIKKIREELTKVAEEIDNIKKEIKLNKDYNLN